MLWSIKTRKSSKIIGYIFGTMHLGTPEAYSYAEIAKNYINLSDVYFSETDIDGLHAQDQSVFCLPDGGHIRQLISPHKYEKYREIILRFTSIDLNHYGYFLPFYLQSIMSTILLQVQNETPLDAYLWHYAKNNGIDCKGIEGIDEQKEILKNIPLQTQVKSFRIMCDHMSSWRSKLLSMQEIYARAEINQLYKMARQQAGGLRKLLLFDRNKIISHRIEASIDQENIIFVSLGAAHLYGNEGILAFLKRGGFIVKPIFD